MTRRPAVSGLKPAAAGAFKFVLFPLFGYFVCFCVSTYPLITQFSSRFYGDEGDGMQNLWNIWHMRRAITSFTNPYFSSMIHYPEGTSLAAHTLSPVNAVFGVILESVLAPYQAYNLMIILAVVTNGLAAFFLARHFCRNYWPSILAGFIYAFSGFMMLHLRTHINLISLEWLPLLLLFWHKLLTRPRYATAGWTALFFILTFYSELYYAFYGGLLLLIFAMAVLLRRGAESFLTRRVLGPIGLFGVISAIAVGPFLFYLYQGASNGGFVDMHDPVNYSNSLLAFVIPGPANRWFYGLLKYGEGGGQGFVGLSVWGLILTGLLLRRGRKQKVNNNFSAGINDSGKDLPGGRIFIFWLLVMIVFLLLSLGPVLHIVNTKISLPMPYTLLEKLPLTNMGGVPERMMAVVILAAAMLCALSLTKIEKNIKRPKLALAAVFLVIAVEYLPFNSRHGNILQPPAYAYALRNLPPGAVFDYNDPYYRVEPPGKTLFAQMIHGHPIYGGYISRRPMTVARKDETIYYYFKDKSFEMLCYYGFRYVVAPAGTDISDARLDYADTSDKIFEFDTSSNRCRAPISVFGRP